MSGTGSPNSNDENGGGATDGGRDANRLDWVFHLLSNHRRRSVLGKLEASADNVSSVDDLADHLLAHDRTTDDRDRVVVALYHKTLPRLDDAGVVDFDRRTDTVRYRQHELVVDLLDLVADESE